MPKHIAIVGSRSRTDRETVDRLVAGFPLDVVIVSGGAPGPDTWAEEAAQKYGLRIHVLRADLSGLRSQGQRTRRYHRRNQLTVDMADEMFALVAPNRRGGTEDAINRARTKGIRVTLL